MTKKKDTKQSVYAGRDTIGYLKVMPLDKPKLNESREVQISSHYTENYKAKQLVDKSTGQLGYKQKAKFTFTEKYCQTQVKFKKSVYPNKYGSSSTKTNYNKNNRNCFWKLVRIASATEESLKKLSNLNEVNARRIWCRANGQRLRNLTSPLR
ncbi:hypothetical protein D8674_014689 [Pyrus ussuriensis x Pyrus communis]|uniref:Uncharacterized protein n=1 Tax=Pyrus ussuriensis x Pyrus communis TaxID=2448454 RepID=A0A5N5H0D2_9ROSA|nr:hypothetical protein D8674_014689 [Pyrus ussuriensis x Pyrus communis]